MNTQSYFIIELVVNLIALSIFSTLLIINRYHIVKGTKENKYLRYLVISGILAELVELVAVAVSGHPGVLGHGVILLGRSFIYVSYCVISWLWFKYFEYHLGIELKKAEFVVMMAVAVGMLMALVNLGTGIVFTVDANNWFVSGPLGESYYWVMLVGGLLTNYMYAKVRKHKVVEFFPVVMFAMPLMLGELLQILVGGFGLIYMGLAIALVGILAGVKNEEIYRDQLTHIYNRSYFDYLMRGIQKTNRVSRNLWLGFMIDLNDFKGINDRLGHEMGDQALIDAAAIFEKCVGSNGNAIRYSGDEFILLVEADGTYTVDSFIEMLQEEIHAFNDLHLRDYQIACSIGGKLYDPERMNQEDFLRSIDQKMYESKTLFYGQKAKFGRRKEDYQLGHQGQFEEIVRLMDYGFERALEEGQFQVYYQPQYNQRDHSLYGAEALVRWIHPEKGAISPANFVPFLEQNGMISKLDEYVLIQTCKQQRAWMDAGIKIVPVSVNLSRRDLQMEDICERVEQALTSVELPVRYLNLEVTESAYMEQPERVIDVVQQFKEMGFQVEMDDFGSGYSSLNSLKDIPVDVLKLDMKFLEGDSIGGRSGKILSSMVRMAHWLGMPVIVEGVETAEQADFLRDIGCFFVQGYYFDRPLPMEEFEKRLRTSKPDVERYSRITRKNETEIEYLANEGMISLLMDSSVGAMGIIEYDSVRMELIRGNEALYDLFRFTEVDEQKGRFAFEDIFYDQGREIFLQALQEAIEKMDASHCECQCVSEGKQTQPFWLQFLVKFIRGYDGVYTFLISAKEINEYKNAQRTNQLLYKLMEEMENRGIFGSILLELEDPMKVTYFNESTAILLGYSVRELRELMDQDAMAMILEEDRTLLTEEITKAKTTGILSTCIRHHFKDGSVKPLSVIGLITINPSDGRPVAKIMIGGTEAIRRSMDTTDLTNNGNAAVAASDWRMITDTLGEAFIRYSVNEKIVMEASPKFVEMLGYTEEEFEQKRYSRLEQFVWPDDWEEVVQELDQSGVETKKFECRLRCRDGSFIHVYAAKKFIELLSGQELVFIQFSVDNLVHGLRAQMAKQMHLAQIMENNAHDGIIFYEISGKRWKLQEVTKGYLDIVGYTMEQIEQLTQNDLLALVHPEEREYVRSEAIRHLRDLSDYHMKCRILKADGEYTWLMTYASFNKVKEKIFLCQSNIPLTNIMEDARKLSV